MKALFKLDSSYFILNDAKPEDIGVLCRLHEVKNRWRNEKEPIEVGESFTDLSFVADDSPKIVGLLENREALEARFKELEEQNILIRKWWNEEQEKTKKLSEELNQERGGQ